MPASFNGYSLGVIFQMTTEANPKERQINAYPGADGLQVIDHGSRGGSTVVVGALVASSGGGLAAIERQFRALQVDGRPGVLLDTLGTTWANVILVQYRPVGRVTQLVNFLYGRNYQAEFLHLY